MSDNNQSQNTDITLGSITSDSYNYMNNLLLNPTIIIIVTIILVLYVILFILIGNTSTSTENGESKNGGLKMLGIIAIAIIGVVIIINAFAYFLGVDIITKLKNLFSPNPEIDIKVDTSRAEAVKAPVPEILIKKQVFNIPSNEFVYEDAKALCKAYGARLATYKELEDAYNKGANWCNYGWSEGQMALYPTQYETWKALQKIEGHENDCGRPGINGGYMINPLLKFGVNCYGYKPRMTQKEKELMETNPVYPKTKKDIAMEQRVEYWKNELPNIIVSPFNQNNWSRL